jgi:hypothetical protein
MTDRDPSAGGKVGEQSRAGAPRPSRPLHLIHGGASFHFGGPRGRNPAATHPPKLSLNGRSVSAVPKVDTEGPLTQKGGRGWG